MAGLLMTTAIQLSRAMAEPAAKPLVWGEPLQLSKLKHDIKGGTHNQRTKPFCYRYLFQHKYLPLCAVVGLDLVVSQEHLHFVSNLSNVKGNGTEDRDLKSPCFFTGKIRTRKLDFPVLGLTCASNCEIRHSLCQVGRLT